MESPQRDQSQSNPQQRSYVVFRLNNAAATAGGGVATGAHEDFDFTALEPQQFLQGGRLQNGINSMRNHLFHVMLVKFSLGYVQHTSRKLRRLLEFAVLAGALISLSMLVYLHYLVPAAPSHCLDHIKETWPKRGIVRVEIITDWDEYNAYIAAQQKQRQYQTHFSLKDVFLYGPKVIPEDLKKAKKRSREPPPPLPVKLEFDSLPEAAEIGLKAYFNRWKRHLNKIIDVFNVMFINPLIDSETYPDSHQEYDNRGFLEVLHTDLGIDDSILATQGPYLYVVEFSLHHGLLRLPVDLRSYYNIPVMLVQLSATDENQCLAPYRRQGVAKYLMGYDDVLMNSVKTLTENLSEKGYLYDLVKNEHYHFVSYAPNKFAYVTGLFVMLIFTFAISLLLRFSHHQIFLFIVDLLHVLELNQSLVFPIAPLLTVLLALVGMEAIMSEVFIDSTTPFYVILLVWIADQYDSICCHSPIGRRHWLKFFYLYHYAFYAYHYRYSGQYSGSALITSAAFVVHSMIYFYHHYELPIILYNDKLQRLIRRLQQQGIELRQRGHSDTNSDILDAESSLPRGEVIRAISISRNTPEPLRSEILREALRMNLTVLGDEPEPSPTSEMPTSQPTTVSPEVLEGAEITADNLVQQTMNELFDPFANNLDTSPTTEATGDPQ